MSKSDLAIENKVLTELLIGLRNKLEQTKKSDQEYKYCEFLGYVEESISRKRISERVKSLRDDEDFREYLIVFNKDK